MARAGGGRLRGLAVNVALAGAAVLIFFGLAEGALRVTGLAPSRALRSPDLRTLDAIPGIYTPGQEFTDRVRREFPAQIRINNLGFRGRDLSEGRPPGTLRVMVLGDSYTFGDHVDTAESYPARLEEILAQRIAALPPAARASQPGAAGTFEPAPGRKDPPPGRHGAVEVINAGVNGYGIRDARMLWEKAGGRLNPDIVIVTFSPNDVSDITREVPISRQMRENARLKSAPLLGPVLRLAQNTALFNGMQILRARMIVATGRRQGAQAAEPARAGPQGAPEAWEGYRQALIPFLEELEAGRRRTLLVLYPSHPHVAAEEPYHAGEILPRWAAEAGIPCLDLLPALRRAARRGDKLYLVPQDSHPTPAGHLAAARAVAERIQELGWLGG